MLLGHGRTVCMELLLSRLRSMRKNVLYFWFSFLLIYSVAILANQYTRAGYMTNT